MQGSNLNANLQFLRCIYGSMHLIAPPKKQNVSWLRPLQLSFTKPIHFHWQKTTRKNINQRIKKIPSWERSHIPYQERPIFASMSIFRTSSRLVGYGLVPLGKYQLFHPHPSSSCCKKTSCTNCISATSIGNGVSPWL